MKPVSFFTALRLTFLSRSARFGAFAPSRSAVVWRKVLIVDDDVRHIFAVTSMLEQYDMQVFYAENGKKRSTFSPRSLGLK